MKIQNICILVVKIIYIICNFDQNKTMNWTQKEIIKIEIQIPQNKAKIPFIENKALIQILKWAWEFAIFKCKKYGFGFLTSRFV